MMAMRSRNPMLATLAAQGVMFAGIGSMVREPITVVGAQADVIPLAMVTAVAVDQSSRVVTITLRTKGTLKGQPGNSTLQADVVLPPSQFEVPDPKGIDAKAVDGFLVGSCGIWFLRTDQTGYHIVPTSTVYSPEDLFFRQDCRSMASAPSGTLNQKLLAYVVRWYEGFNDPFAGDDRLQACFQPWKPGMANVAVSDLLSAAATLAASPVLYQHVMGLVLAVQLGAVPALSQALTELDTLKTSPNFAYFTGAITVSQPSAETLPILLREVTLHTDALGLDNAVGSALMRAMGNRSVVPAMAALLNSKDPVAQLRAARFFSVFTLRSDALGNVVAGAPDGPLATAETRSFAPSRDSGKTTEQYVQFWKQWWTLNAPKLGFSVQWLQDSIHLLGPFKKLRRMIGGPSRRRRRTIG
jgi:hypothetical protein